MPTNGFLTWRELARFVVPGFALGALALGVSALPAQATRIPALATQASFTFSGAMTGKLTVPQGDCQPASQETDIEFDVSKALPGFPKGADAYTVEITNKGGGTFSKLSTTSIPGVQLQVQTSSSEYVWRASSGSFTVNKTGTAGSLKVGLVPYNNYVQKPGTGNVTITGTWNCPPV